MAPHKKTMYRKAKIPRALREQVWVTRFGRKFDSKCYTPWCKNIITVFDFQCGHDIPESKGGKTNLQNLFPICSRCNMSMGNTYNFKQWSEKGNHTEPEVIPRKWTYWLSSLCIPKWTSSDTKDSGTKSLPNPTNQKNKRIK